MRRLRACSRGGRDDNKHSDDADWPTPVFTDRGSRRWLGVVKMENEPRRPDIVNGVRRFFCFYCRPVLPQSPLAYPAPPPVPWYKYAYGPGVTMYR